MVDVARLLGMSHGNVYRHFASKAALQEAVAERWLHAVSAPLAEIAARAGPAAERLLEWMVALAEIKQRKVLDDPELFATYHALAEDSRAVVDAHLADLRAQVARIIADGVTEGVFRVSDAAEAAETALGATLPFHHPHLIRSAPIDAGHVRLRKAVAMVTAGLAAGVV